MTEKFGLSVDDLVQLHQSRDVKKLEELGGPRGLADALGTDVHEGIPEADVKNGFTTRRKIFGENRLPEPPSTSLFELIWEGLQDKTLILLMVSSVVSLVLGIMENPSSGWIEGTAILIAVFLVVTVTALNDYQKERQFRKLNARKNNKQIKVVRAGEQCQVSIFELNVGDVVVIDTGDIIPADGIFLEGHNMKCDESAMTGEPDAIKKSEGQPFLLSGCQVLEGVGRMLVVAVGPHSESGRAMALLQKSDDEGTPLQQKLEVLAEQIAQFGLVAAVLILIVLVVKFFVLNYINGVSFELHMLSVLVRYFITSITIVVVAVPEGLPLAVTIALAYSMVKMLKDQNLVRHLESCETMGGATTICSDKTGTLTKNQMTVLKGWISGRMYDKTADCKDLPNEIKDLLGTGIAVNSTAYEGYNDSGKLVFIGSKTECALLNFAKELDVTYKEVRERIPVKHLYPFSSARKRMSTLVDNPDGKGYRLFSKGASEIILGLCNDYIAYNGYAEDLTDEIKEELRQTIHTMATEGLRTIALGYVDYKDERDWERDEEVEHGFTLLGIVGIKDPVRDEVPAAVRKCISAGIVVRMVTGDNIETAKKIAQECGIYTGPPGIAIQGPDFRGMSDSERDAIVPNIQVMARSSPTDKHLLVSRLKHFGHVVAVTGDGTNDAPALKEAHVGFAMGIAGTEVAKEASDIILMDDNFTSIVKAVMWGRNVYDSIRKFLQFQLTVNIVAVMVAFVGAVSNEHGESPLKPVQLLWVNLIMDTMAALALATEAPSEALLERKPYGKTDPLITNTMWKNIVGQALYQLVVNLFVLYYGHLLFGVEKDGVVHLTVVFNVFVFCQIFNEISCRKINDELNVFSGLFTNGVFVGIMVFTVTMQYAIIEFGGEFTSTHTLTGKQWLFCVLAGALCIPFGVLIKMLPVMEPPSVVPPPPKPAPLAPRSKIAARWKRVVAHTKEVSQTHEHKHATLFTSLRRQTTRTPGWDNK